jgi:hypothetical protein
MKLGLPEIDHWLNLSSGQSHNFGFKLSDLECDEYRHDPRRLIARLSAVPFSVFWAWYEAGGIPSCRATTAKGKPCKGRIPGTILITPKAWENYAGGYCFMHGGDQ